MRRLAAVDAQTFWMSTQVPNDQFLLYTFAGVFDGLDDVLAGLADRARACPDLTMRVADGCALRYPRWVPAPVDANQVRLHAAGLSWAACLSVVAALADDQLDPRSAAWRLHVFASVSGAPGASSPVTVAVVQIAHCLADGTRSAELAAWLFGRDVPVRPLAAGRRGSLVLRGITAACSHRAMVRDLEAGRLAPAGEPQLPILTNNAPAGPRRIRTLLRQRSALPAGRTVTVAVLNAIGVALDGYLRDRIEDPARLSAEVLLAKPGIRLAQNHFRSIGVGLHPRLDPIARAGAIDADLRAGRSRAEHPATLAADRAFAATPAPLLRWGVAQFDPAVRAARVTGATVVSSVNRGPADLHFGPAPVLWTAGYPALSPMMGLTHGVHGLGDTIAVSVHGAESGVDIDDYTARLDCALGR